MKRVLIIILFIISAFVTDAFGQGIKNSRHNLSASGPGNIKSMDDSRVCVFCHTTHTANPKAPMWNRKQSGATYILYDSSTLNANPGQPDGTSILCLSCHDGTVAMGNTLKNPKSMSFARSMTRRGNLGTDLSDDHPISFVFDPALSVEDGELKDPGSLDPHILDNNNKLQCISCHDPHKDIQGNFLNRSNEFSDLCFSCHDKKYWGESTHSNSTATWNGNFPEPWSHLENPYTTVGQNGCANCHDVHNAQGKERLLKRSAEEDNCLDCHNGNVAEKNLQVEFLKPYKHDVYMYTGVHDPVESDINKSKHVECVDCHNPHAMDNSTAEAPLVKGANRYVKGVNDTGLEIFPVTNEYEICFRCHGDNSVTTAYTSRYLGTANTRTDFLASNVSYHPVVDVGRNDNPRGLIQPYNASSRIYCSSCHASDGKNSPAGPHGSIYPRILKANYNMERTPQLGKSWPSLIQSNFELCFECHDLSSVTNVHQQMSDGHFMETIGCNSCHDPHGFEGGNMTENAYGINFDQSVIQPNPISGKLIDLDQKKCFMTCHDPGGVINYTHKPEGDDY